MWLVFWTESADVLCFVPISDSSDFDNCTVSPYEYRRNYALWHLTSVRWLFMHVAFPLDFYQNLITKLVRKMASLECYNDTWMQRTEEQEAFIFTLFITQPYSSESQFTQPQGKKSYSQNAFDKRTIYWWDLPSLLASWASWTQPLDTERSKEHGSSRNRFQGSYSEIEPSLDI